LDYSELIKFTSRWYGEGCYHHLYDINTLVVLRRLKIITAVQSERSAALATLLTVQVARFAVSVLDAGVVLSIGTATATATSEARRRKEVKEGIVPRNVEGVWETGGYIMPGRSARQSSLATKDKVDGPLNRL
jgi:hypothetical protein